MEKACIECQTKFKTKSNRSTYCSSECKASSTFNRKQEKIKLGVEGEDYIIDLWNGYATPRIYGKWMKSMHPGKTTEDYLNEFPGAPIACNKDKQATTKKSGLHMKDPKYRKMASDAIKGKLNPNHSSKISEEIRKSRSPFSEKFKKYSTKKERDDFVKNIDWDSRVTSNQLDWWLNKGYSEIEAIEKLRERQTTFTLGKCIKKYGEKLGTQKFNERQKRWKKSLYENFEREGDGRSPSSKFANSIIKELCEYLKIEIPQKEKWARCKDTGKSYSYDFTYKEKIIEFNGDYWHCNPDLYEADYINKNKGLTAEEIWKYDKEKIKMIESHGYSVLTIWEGDWKNSPDKVLEKCKKFLLND